MRGLRRLILPVVLALLPNPASARAHVWINAPYLDPSVWNERLVAHPPVLSRRRLPAGFRIGRCLLVVDGRTFIDGRCAYRIDAGGEFEMDGARQVYAGIDFPASLDMADSVSTDYFVQVDHELRDDGSVDSGWEAHWNADKRANHAQASLGPVSKQGACFINASARICLWAR